MKKCGFGLVVLLVVVAVARQCPAARYSPDYTTINERNFGYYVPESYDPSTPTPLLFMFHGMGGNSSEQSGGSAENGYYGWQTSAHENGFIVLFPESLGFLKTWDLGAGGSSSDLPFVDELIDWATTNYNISTSQIFTTGHSWGAYFSYYVARYRSDDIAAFATHSGGLGGFSFLGSTPPVPTGPSPTPTLNGIVLHAVDDGLVPYSNSQDLYDDLLANGHNVYNDGIGDDGIIEVDGWGPDNHRYRLQHNQTQWDFFLSVAPTSFTSIADGLWDTDDGGTPTDPWDQDGVPTADNPVIVNDGFTVTVDGTASALSVDVGQTLPSELQVDDTLTVSGGATIHSSGTLSGTGTLAGNVVLQSGGILSPGNGAGVLSAGSGITPVMEPNPIPEPAALTLLGIGACWLLVWRRR